MFDSATKHCTTTSNSKCDIHIKSDRGSVSTTTATSYVDQIPSIRTTPATRQSTTDSSKELQKKTVQYSHELRTDNYTHVLANQVSTPLQFIVEDTSAVPAWVISFLVLLAVIVLIVIVLVLY